MHPEGDAQRSSDLDAQAQHVASVWLADPLQGEAQGSFVGDGRTPSVTSIVRFWPSAPTTCTGTRAPGFSPARMLPTSSLEATACPSIPTITSPWRIPATSAGPPEGMATT